MLLRDLWGVRSFYPSFKWWAGYFGMIDLVERNDQCENPKSWNIVSKEMSCTMWARGGRRDMTRGVPWSLPLVNTTSAIRSWTQKCFFSFILSFSSSLEERVCSGKNVVRKQKELAKINKHGMSLLRLSFARWKCAGLGWRNSALYSSSGAAVCYLGTKMG